MDLSRLGPSISLALNTGMEYLELEPTKKSFLSKRSTWKTAAAVASISFVMGVMNSMSFPQALESMEEHLDTIQQLVLDDMVLTRDPHIVYHREDILSDYENRISDEFSIPPGLRERVGFWFDIYTVHDSFKKVVHHGMYPWMIFKVIDVTDIINSDTPRVRWLRNVKADEYVTKEVQKWRAALKTLAKTGKANPKDEYQVSAAQTLEPMVGSLKKKAQEALKSLRVQTGQKNFFASGLEVSPRYLPAMEEIFRDQKLPVELTRLPFVESSFNKHAVSKVGASGIWQFMDYTGKSFMTVNEHIDERNSPFKATIAAAKLLKENHLILKRSWPLAITAWNHGPSGVRKAMKSVGSEDISDIVGSYQTRAFDFASSNFYSEFLAALYAEKYHDQIYVGLNYEKALDLHSVKLARSVGAKQLLKKSGLSVEDFTFYNPDLKKAVVRNVTIPKGFTLMVDTPARITLKTLLTLDTRHKDETTVTQTGVSYQNGAEISAN